MKAIEFLLQASVGADRLVQPLYEQIFRTFGVSYYSFFRPSAQQSPSKSFVSDEYSDFVTEVAGLIRGGTRIKISVGEMGHHFIDNPVILGAFYEAFLNNNAQIEILHGPRVDPLTSEVFTFARRHMINLYDTVQYVPHHFVIIHNRNGTVSLADENPHNEALWEIDKETGETINVYRSRSRVWYVLEDAGEYVGKLERVFEDRKARSIKTNEKPDAIHSYPSPTLRIFKTSIENAFFRSIVQPLLVIRSGFGLGLFAVSGVLFCLALIAAVRVLSFFVITSFLLIIYSISYALPRVDKMTLSSIRSAKDMERKTRQERYANEVISPILSLIDRIATDDIAILRLQQIYIHVASIKDFYSPDDDESMVSNIEPEQTIEFIRDIVEQFPGSRDDKQILLDNALSLISQFKNNPEQSQQARELLQVIVNSIERHYEELAPVPEAESFLAELHRL